MFFRPACTINEDGGAVTHAGSPEQSALHRAMVSLAKCMGARQHQEVYLSAPITTGTFFLNWRQTSSAADRDDPAYKAQHRREVIEKNIARIAPLVTTLRSRFSDRLVIDPTVLDDVDEWVQSDYHKFWCEMIKRYARTVVFADGWQLSQGCVREFVTALTSGAELLDETLRPISVSTGVKMIVDAVSYFDQLGQDSSDMRRSLVELQSVIAGGEPS